MIPRPTHRVLMPRRRAEPSEPMMVRRIRRIKSVMLNPDASTIKNGSGFSTIGAESAVSLSQQSRALLKIKRLQPAKIARRVAGHAGRAFCAQSSRELAR